MYKKLSIATSAVILAVLSFGQVAYAQAPAPQDPPRGGRRGVGQIIEIGEDRFTVETRQDEERTLVVNDETRYRDTQGNELAFADLVVGQWVAGIIAFDGADLQVAHLVIILPEDYDPSQRLGTRERGVVIAVDSAAGSFTLQNRQGYQVSFSVNENTQYRGSLESLADIQPGMQAAAGGFEQPDGSLLAAVIMARFPLHRNTGIVSQVDLDAGRLTLDTRKGGTVEFSVDENTRFRGMQSEIENLGDIQPGMVALLVSHPGADGNELAVAIAAGERENLPHFDLKVIGQVSQVNATTFVIQSRAGEQYTLQVDDATRFRSRGGRVSGLDELEEGMRVVVGAQETDTGDYLAKVILVGQRNK